ncbi:acyl-CoA thioesterase [Bacillus solimangrovi]|uniref:Uncharacterized protein n=1 Tax=Bacillus solimangrovi TaxID=1305675 RepID=A0A1E5LCU3_9BACI|nr:thioesterase family protein [Bacillus solimangrovi]OEH91908.1 hypothetical protein BFG57_04020 [Bacillus solimangrovi]
MSKISYIDNFTDWAESFKYHKDIEVRFSETDMFGHLNNTVAFVYFEQARVSFFGELGFMSDWLKKNSETIIVTADLQCDFMQQIYFGDTLEVYVKVAHFGNTSADLHYMAKTTDGRVCLTGRGRIVHISKKLGKPSPWTDEMINRLEEYSG